jgi:hypothetical protein
LLPGGRSRPPAAHWLVSTAHHRVAHRRSVSVFAYSFSASRSRDCSSLAYYSSQLLSTEFHEYIGGALVIVTSDDLSIASVRGSVLVPQGATTATFTIDTTSILTQTVVGITASFNGISQTIPLTALQLRSRNLSVGRPEHPGE